MDGIREDPSLLLHLAQLRSLQSSDKPVAVSSLSHLHLIQLRMSVENLAISLARTVFDFDLLIAREKERHDLLRARAEKGVLCVRVCSCMFVCVRVCSCVFRILVCSLCVCLPCVYCACLGCAMLCRVLG
jgi:hypothetical protein